MNPTNQSQDENIQDEIRKANETLRQSGHKQVVAIAKIDGLDSDENIARGYDNTYLRAMLNLKDEIIKDRDLTISEMHDVIRAKEKEINDREGQMNKLLALVERYNDALSKLQGTLEELAARADAAEKERVGLLDILEKQADLLGSGFADLKVTLRELFLQFDEEAILRHKQSLQAAAKLESDIGRTMGEAGLARNGIVATRKTIEKFVESFDDRLHDVKSVVMHQRSLLEKDIAQLACAPKYHG